MTTQEKSKLLSQFEIVNGCTSNDFDSKDWIKFDDGLVIFLSAKKLTNDEFYEIYHKHVNTSNNPWGEDTLK